MLSDSARSACLALVSLSALAPLASADPGHQGQTGSSTLATSPVGQAPAPLGAPAPVNYTPPPPVGQRPMNVQRTVMVNQPAPESYVPPPPVTQQQRNVDARPGLFGSVQGGVTVPVQGDLGDYAAVGGVGIIQGGWELNGGFSARLELGFRINSIHRDLTMIPESERAVFYGLGARYTLARGAPVHPFVEAYLDLFSPLRSQSAGAGSSVSVAGTGVSVGAGAGIEVDVNEQLSLQVSGRFDEVLTDAGGNALTGGLTHVLVGGSYYY